MKKPDQIKLDDYWYDLPDHRIAKYPLEQRDLSKLLVYKDKLISTNHFYNLDKYLDNNDLLVFNNTKVVHARLIFKKTSGARIEIFCLEPFLPSDYHQSFISRKSVKWRCLIGNARRWKNEKLEKTIIQNSKEEITLQAKKTGTKDDSFIIEFSWDNNIYSFSEIITLFGSTPIPPYLNREAEKIDSVRYQTVYSRKEGSVAAPTAGLHFTDEVIDRLKKSNIETQELTLHVGAGTFVPVKTRNAMEHNMHIETFYAKKDLLYRLARNKKRVIAVGTTSCRTLESLYWLGVKRIISKSCNFHLGQWDAWKMKKKISLQDSMGSLYNYLEMKAEEELVASTGIMIVPGYQFQVVSGLLTNFHQPSSTLLMLIAALTGSDWRRIYQYALKNNYRFLSYGDSSLLFR